jgi:hypothetical protein
LTDLTEWREYYHAPKEFVAGKRRAEKISDELASSNSPAADVLLALGKYSSSIEALREASRLRYSRFPLKYEDHREDVNSHLGPLVECAGVLQLRAIAELQLNEGQPALDDASLILRLADALRGEPYWQSQRTRTEIVGRALEPIWEGLAAHRWTDDELAALDAKLAGLNFFSDYELAVRGGRARALADLEGLRHGVESVLGHRSQHSLDFEDRAILLGVSCFPVGWYYQNELGACRIYTESLLPMLDPRTGMISANLAGVFRAGGDELRVYHRDFELYFGGQPAHLNAYNVLAYLKLIAPSPGRYVFAQNDVNLARVACALERYRARFKAYPQKLGDLTPLFAGSLPPDAISGQPLKYRRTGDKFILYSMGRDATDHGGMAMLRPSGIMPGLSYVAGDSVWDYP